MSYRGHGGRRKFNRGRRSGRICKLDGSDTSELDDDYYDRPRENYESPEEKIRNVVVKMGDVVCSSVPLNNPCVNTLK